MTGRIVYFDISKNGGESSVNPSDVEGLTNEDAVLASVINIISHEPRDLIYKKRKIGCRLKQYLFDPIDSSTAYNILKEIEDAVNRFESRIATLDVTVTPLYDENTYDILVAITIPESRNVIEFREVLTNIR